MNTINPDTLIQNELIGLNVEIIQCTNPYVQNIKGKIIDETKNMLIIRQRGVNKKVIKKNTVLKFRLNDEEIKVDGSKLIGRPEDRIKEKIKRKW